MIKLLLSLIIIFSSTLMGNSFSMRISARRRTFENIVAAISRMKTLICFGSWETTRVIDDCLCSSEFPLLDSGMVSSEISFDRAFAQSIEKIHSSFALAKSDKDLLLKFAKGLGTTDVTGQVAHVELYIQLFTERLETIKKLESERSKLYRVLGFSMGSAISLLIA